MCVVLKVYVLKCPPVTRCMSKGARNFELLRSRGAARLARRDAAFRGISEELSA